MNPPDGVKQCLYKSCTNTIPKDSEFTYCEICRTLTVRNSIALTQDPFSPIMDRRDMIMHATINNLRPDELINWTRKMEWAYEELMKSIHSNKLEIHRRNQFEDAMGEVTAKRNEVLRTTKKANAKRKTRADKMTELFGAAAKDIMNEVPDF